MTLSTDENELEIAKLHHDRLWHEIFWRRETEQKVCVWIVGIFAAVLALVYGKDYEIRISQKIALALLPVILGLLGSGYLYINSRKNKEIARVIVKLNHTLGAWKDGFLVLQDDKTLFPEQWKRWGEPENSSFRTFPNDRVSFSYFLLILIAMIICVVGIFLKSGNT